MSVIFFVSAGLSVLLSMLLPNCPKRAARLGLRSDRWAYHTWTFFLLQGGVFLLAGIETLFESPTPWRAVFLGLALGGMVASALIDHAWRKRHSKAKNSPTLQA